MAGPDAWGHDEGREVYSRLLRVVEANPGMQIFRISMDGVNRTDASFPRESVMEIAKRFRGSKGFCLVDVGNQDLIDNWDMAALRKDQPLVVWNKDGSYRIIGPQPSSGNKKMFEYLYSFDYSTAAAAAKAINLSLTNASKLKYLCEQGFLLRRDETAPSGGIEYFYFAIR